MGDLVLCGGEEDLGRTDTLHNDGPVTDPGPVACPHPPRRRERIGREQMTVW
jgi:hypothetical protein